MYKDVNESQSRVPYGPATPENVAAATVTLPTVEPAPQDEAAPAAPTAQAEGVPQ